MIRARLGPAAMAEKKKWDLTSPRSLQAAAEWLRGRAGAEVVLVIRANGWALAAQPGMDAAAAQRAVQEALWAAQEAALFGGVTT